MKTNRLSIVLSILLVAGLACNFSSQQAPQVILPGAVETAVAATLAANRPGPAAVPTEGTKVLAPTPAPALPLASAPTAIPPTPTLQPPVLKIAYTDSSHNLWLWKEGSAPAPLSGSGDVEDVWISKDGNLAAFTRSASGMHVSLWVANIDGTNARQLLGEEDLLALGKDPVAFPGHPETVNDVAGVTPYGISWIPGTHTLAFTTHAYFEGPGFFLANDLQLVNADNGERHALLVPGQGGVASFSPDGKKLLVTTPEKISLLNADGSGRFEVLSYPAVITYSEYQYYAAPHWSPDSSFAVVVIPPQDPMAQPLMASTLYRISADGSPAAPVGQSITSFLTRVMLSPDLSRMAYVSETGNPGENRRTLHVANINGSNDVSYLTDVMVSALEWSPDSSRFAFSVENSHYYLGQVGVGYVPLADAGSVRKFAWLDPGRILFTASNGGGFEMRIGAPGGSSSVIASLPGSPDGTWLAFNIYP
jgi:dipeptidyl aminopeptidase/acylaminoacyl peptidase